MPGNNYKIIGATVITAAAIAAVTLMMWPNILLSQTIQTDNIAGQGELNAASAPLKVDKNLLDERGFIKVWELRMAISEAPIVYPFEEGQCSGSEGDGEEEAPKFKSKKERLAYEREQSRRQQQEQLAYAECLKEAAEKITSKNKALAILNQAWMPALLSATEKGDPVAEVILRLCETAPMLDRTGIASDCSVSPAEQAFARQRLEAINFKPALHKYTPTDDGTLYYEEAKKSCTSSPGDCRYQAATDRYVNILAVMKTGYLGVAEHWNTCQIKGDSTESDKIVEECQRLMNLMEAVASEAPRFYSAGPLSSAIRIDFSNELSLTRPIISGINGEASNKMPFEIRGIVQRNNRETFSDPDFQFKFYDELERTIQTIESNIDEDLRKDPRWAVFLIERINGRLYDAMNKNDPKRPSPEEISQYVANCNLDIHKKRIAQEKYLRDIDPKKLISSLYEVRQVNYSYSKELLPINVMRLIKAQYSVKNLIESYFEDRKDWLFRFNIILILVEKLEPGYLESHEVELITQCLLQGLHDEDPWNRAKSVYGLSLYSTNSKYLNEIKKLIADPNDVVRQEVNRAVNKLL